MKANAVKTISIETRDGKLDVENFSRELMKYIPGDEKEFNWLDNYKDFSSFPLPFKMDVYVLLDCIEQMIKYRFEITMTEKCLRYIIDEYSKLENQELKEDFMCKWIDCLTLVESMGDEYKEVYAQNMMRVCQDIIREEYEVLNPVWRNYFSLCVKYKCGLETK